MKSESQPVFNFLDGTLKEYPAEDLATLNDGYHVILSEGVKLNSNGFIVGNSCKKCYGRIKIGQDTLSKNYVACNRCLKKYQDKEFFQAMVDTVVSEVQEEMKKREQGEGVNVAVNQ